MQLQLISILSKNPRCLHLCFRTNEVVTTGLINEGWDTEWDCGQPGFAPSQMGGGRPVTAPSCAFSVAAGRSEKSLTWLPPAPTAALSHSDFLLPWKQEHSCPSHSGKNLSLGRKKGKKTYVEETWHKGGLGCFHFRESEIGNWKALPLLVKTQKRLFRVNTESLLPSVMLHVPHPAVGVCRLIMLGNTSALPCNSTWTKSNREL